MNDLRYPIVKELGKYQLEWLNKYHTIDVRQWRCEFIDIKQEQPIGVDWYYVGDWKPTEIEPYPSKKDGGYGKRRTNLKNNPYFYWPTNNVKKKYNDSSYNNLIY